MRLPASHFAMLILPTAGVHLASAGTQRSCVLHECMQAVEVPLEVAQTAAVLEIVHSALGLVRSPLMITGET